MSKCPNASSASEQQVQNNSFFLQQTAALENGSAVSYKVKHTFMWPLHPTPRYLLRRKESLFHPKTLTQMFTAALFVSAPNWKQLIFPLMNGQTTWAHQPHVGHHSGMKRMALDREQNAEPQRRSVSERSQSKHLSARRLHLWDIFKKTKL